MSNELRHDTETQAYKDFGRVAKKLNQLQYGKWTIAPDPADPLRKFLITKDIGYAHVQLAVYMRQTYHRGEYDYNKRDYYKPEIMVIGLSAEFERRYSNFRMPLKPRMVHKIIEKIDGEVTPRFDMYINETRLEMDKQLDTAKKYKAQVSVITGLKINEDKYGRKSYELNGCPFHLSINEYTLCASISGEVGLTQFKELADKMGWGK